MNSFLFDFTTMVGIVVVAEFADKTNLLALSIMGKYKKPYTVALGGLTGIALITMLGVVFGKAIASILPLDYFPILSGILFIWIGLAELMEDHDEHDHDEKEQEVQKSNTDGDLGTFTIFRRSLVLIGLAEFGDKSQFIVIARAIEADPIAIFAGAVVGMGIIMFLTAIFGERLIHKFPEEIIHKIANYGFVIVGLLLLATGLWNIL